MKKILKSIFVLITAMALVFSSMYFSDETAVNAESPMSGKCGDNLTWQLVEDPVWKNFYTLVISGTGDMYDYDNHNFSSDNLHPWPFYNGTSDEGINDIVIEDGVTSIGAYAFQGCTSYDPGYGRYPTITIPDSVTRIGCGALSGNAFKTIDIPVSVTEIEPYAFNFCNKLEEIVIPSSVSVISDGLFSSCMSLVEVSMHNDITEIGSDAFTRCDDLEKIDIPNSVKSIGRSAFRACGKLKKVILPIGLKSIESGTFEYCSSLPSIEIPETVTSIGKNAFANCTSLSRINIPEGVDTIGSEAFKSCKMLSSVHIPKSVTSIQYSAFKECTELEDVYYTGSEAQWEAITIGNWNEELLSATLHCSGEDSTENDFISADKSFEGEFGYHYSDSYFSHSAKDYDHSLATMSLCLAFSAYGNLTDPADPSYNNYGSYDKNVKAVLKGCGFTGPNYKRYKQYSFNAKPTKTSIGCAIGSKQLSDGTTLIAVAVRGGGYEAEWDSNFDVGHTGDHYGFNDAANQVCGYLTDYINEKEISGKIKIWITGYSRAGAAATQAAAKLDRGEVQGVSIDNTDVYAYGFATPMGAIEDNDPSNPIYDNIFSIIHYHDIVPLVAPEKWGFGRYGNTYVFPYKTSSKESNSYERRMKDYLEDMGCQYEVDNFKTGYAGFNDSLGLCMRKLVDSFAKNVGDGIPSATAGRIAYRLKYQREYQTFFGSGIFGKHRLEFWLGLGLVYADNLVDGRDLSLLGRQAVSNPRITTAAVSNCKLLFKAHADQRYYVAWMQSMDGNYVEDAHRYLMSGNGRAAKFKCPVDVEVTDSEGNLVATIINEEPWQDEEASVIASIDENGQKTVYLPTDEDYSITVTAREDCSMIYTVEETAASSLEPVRVTNYNIDDLSENEEIEAIAGKYPEEEIEQAATEASSAEYIVLKDGQVLDPSLELNDPEEVEAHTYTVTTEFNEEEGTVYGTGHYIEGSAVLLTAENNPGYIFDGFYLNGNKLSDEDLDNDSSTVQLIVNDNADIQAKFTKCDHADMAQFVSKASFSKDGYIWKGCSECGYDELTPIPAAVVKLSNKDFTYNKNTQKPSVTIKGLKEGTDYTVVNAGGRDIGRYKVAVTLKGDRYEGSQELTYNINPKGATISRPKAAKKAITAKWKAQKARMPKNRVTGYEVQISTKKDFSSGNKTYAIKGYKKTSRKITKLKAGKKYFVRVRTYMNVKGSGTFYSAWSKVKTVKVK